MAKYIIGSTGNQTVNCEILNESAGRYIVRFKSGVIKDVDKNRVKCLDAIDEGVLEFVNEGKLGDILKGAAKGISDFGKRAGDAIKSAFEYVVTKIIKVNNRIWFQQKNGDFVQAIHPINAMLAASETEDIGFIPSDDDEESCETLGITCRQFEPKFEENPYCGSEIIATDLESMNEAEAEIEGSFGLSAKDRLQLVSKEFVDMNTTDLVDCLIAQYSERYHYEENTDNLLSAPIILFGAPGTGKTSIVNSLKDKLGVRVITINAPSIEPESFTMPASVQSIQNEIGKKDAKKKTIKDLPKSWLPVYDEDVSDFPADEQEDVLMQRRYAANGALPDENGRYEHDGPGGFLFIDEFLRMTESGIASIFDFPLSRHLGMSSTITLGDRWIVIGASNRYSDLSSSARDAAVEFEAAQKQRFEFVNFVPTFEEWDAWAEKQRGASTEKGDLISIPDMGNIVSISNVNRHFRNFIRKTYSGPDNPGAFYAVKKNQNAKKFDIDDVQVSPRRWEQFSSMLVSMTAVKYPELFKSAVKEAEYPYGDDFVLSIFDDELIRKKCVTYLGRRVSDALRKYIQSLGSFTQDDAENIFNDVAKDIPQKFIDEFRKEHSNPNAFLNRVVKAPFRDVISKYWSEGQKVPDDGVYKVIRFIDKLKKQINDPSVLQVTLDLMMKWCRYKGIGDLQYLPKSYQYFKTVDPYLYRLASKQ